MALEAAKHGMGLAMGRWFLVMPAVLRGELVMPVDYKIPSGMGYQLYCSREHVQRPRYQAFAQWLQRTIDEWQEIKEASLSATHPLLSQTIDQTIESNPTPIAWVSWLSSADGITNGGMM